MKVPRSDMKAVTCDAPAVVTVTGVCWIDSTTPSYGPRWETGGVLSCGAKGQPVCWRMSVYVKVFGCRPRDDRATCSGAGVRKPPGQETAGRVCSVVERAMGKVVLADVCWSASAIESGWCEAPAHADEHAWRRIWWLQTWLRCLRCSASVRHQRARPCRRSRVGGTCEEPSDIVLA
jgi:hypothetical protein